jgi:hypothetical protein
MRPIWRNVFAKPPSTATPATWARVLTAPTAHRLVRTPTVRIQDLDGAPLLHFAPENGLSTWLDQSLTRAGVRPEPVMRTSVRSFSPRWVRQLVAVTPAALDPLATRFIGNLRTRGLRVPSDVRTQLAADDSPTRETRAPS